MIISLNMHQPAFYWAVFALIRNEEGQILFSRRSNTWHLDGYLSLPAWHVEAGEYLTDAMKRELSEEIWIQVTDLRLICSQQSRHRGDEETYFNFYFQINAYSGRINNNEKDRCSDLIFLSLEDAQRDLCVPYVWVALESIAAWEDLSEIVWSL